MASSVAVRQFMACERAFRSPGASQFERHNIAGAILSRHIAAEPEAAQRALLELYALQTADERAQRKTAVRNGQGFGARYAVRASHLAEDVLRGDALSSGDLEFATDVVNVHRDQLFTWVSSRTRLVIFAGDDGAYEAAMGELDAGRSPMAGSAGARVPPAKRTRVIDDSTSEGEEEEEEEDEQEEGLGHPCPEGSLPNAVMSFVINEPLGLRQRAMRADEMAAVLQGMGYSTIKASQVHEMRQVHFIARGTAIATGGTCWARLDGTWVYVDVVAFVNGGVSRIKLDGRERFVTLSAYYADEQSTAAEAG